MSQQVQPIARGDEESDEANRARWNFAGRMGFVGYVGGLALALEPKPLRSRWLDQNERTALLLCLLGSGVGFGAGLLTGSLTDITATQATVLHSHAMVGFWNGILLNSLGRHRMGGAGYAGLTGLGAGLVLTTPFIRHFKMTPGAAQFAQNFSLFAMETALFTSLSIGGSPTFTRNRVATLVSATIATNGALIGGYFIGTELQWTERDQAIIMMGGLAGNGIGALVVLASLMYDLRFLDFLGGKAQRDNQAVMRGMGRVMLCSMLGGLAVSTLIVRPWRSARKENRTSSFAANTNGSLLHLGKKGWKTGIPAFQLIPSEYRGQRTVGIHVPLLSVGL
jgi:hypothetical protein